MLRKLPIGIQSFEQIRSGGYVYVDKTRPLAGMIDRGKSFFLSRPRRFGKSLTVSTFQAQDTFALPEDTQVISTQVFGKHATILLKDTGVGATASFMEAIDSWHPESCIPNDRRTLPGTKNTPTTPSGESFSPARSTILFG